MRLCEISFGANVPFEWVKQSPEHYRADFESKDRRYFVDFYTGNWDGTPCWMFQFGIYQSDKDASTMRMTKLKNPYSVLSTVKAVFDDFMRRKHPACLAFYDGDRIPSRMRWYAQFAHYVADRYGYRQDDAMMQKAMRTLSSKDTFLWILKRGRQDEASELADLETSYRRLKAKRDQLNRDTDDLPYPKTDLDPHAPPSIRQVLVPDDATYQRKRRYRALMRDRMTSRIIEMNHELALLRARIRSARRKGTPEELFVNYDSQKTKYERSYLHEIGQMIDQADGALPYPAADAVTRFVGHAYSKSPEGGAPGFMAEEQLEDAYAAHPSEKGVEIRQQLDAAFAPIRDALRQQFGDAITIHRAQSPLTGTERPRNVLSWTSNLKFAESLLDTGTVLRDLLTKTVAVEDIVWITDRANQSEFIVRNRQTLGEGEEMGDTLPATPENIEAAKSFVFGKWRERARELGRDDPVDLSDACKFTSLFAATVFGGTMRGNFFHQWVALPDGRTLDLNDEAADVITMLRGELPDDAKDYASSMRKKLPPSLYTPDERHMRSRGNHQSMASVRPRVQQWADEFLRRRMLGEARIMKTYRVAWGRNQYAHLGTETVKASSERDARRQVRQSLDDRYFSHHGMKILYVTEVDADQTLTETTRPAYYHVTPTKNLPSIRQEGLMPQRGALSALAGEAKPAIYLFRSLVAAEEGVMNWMGDYLPDDEPLALIKVTLPVGMRPRRNESEFGYEFIVYQPIPPAYLEVLTTDLDTFAFGDDE